MATKKENTALIETYKGVDIFYNKGDGNVYADFPKMKIKFCETNIAKIKWEIDKLSWEDCDVEGYVYTYHLMKVKAFRKNKATKRIDFEVVEDAQRYGSDKGKIYTNEDSKIYPETPERKKLWNEIVSLYAEAKKLDRRAEVLISSLRRVGKK